MRSITQRVESLEEELRKLKWNARPSVRDEHGLHIYDEVTQ
jgi:hypothetical protein